MPLWVHTRVTRCSIVLNGWKIWVDCFLIKIEKNSSEIFGKKTSRLVNCYSLCNRPCDISSFQFLLITVNLVKPVLEPAPLGPEYALVWRTCSTSGFFKVRIFGTKINSFSFFNRAELWRYVGISNLFRVTFSA